MNFSRNAKKNLSLNLEAGIDMNYVIVEKFVQNEENLVTIREKRSPKKNKTNKAGKKKDKSKKLCFLTPKKKSKAEPKPKAKNPKSKISNGKRPKRATEQGTFMSKTIIDVTSHYRRSYLV